MLRRICSDEELSATRISEGFVINMDYVTKTVVLHRASCPYCDVKRIMGMRPTSKTERGDGEYWFSENEDEATKKCQLLATNSGSLSIHHKCLHALARA